MSRSQVMTGYQLGLTFGWNKIKSFDEIGDLRRWGMDESKQHMTESQWIVVVGPFCHLQYPVTYLILFWSNSSNLILVFCTHAKKNITFNLSKFGG